MTKNQWLLAWFLCLSLFLNANKIDIYNKGMVTFQPIPAFGNNVDWVEMFFNGDAGVAIAPDGCIFVSNNRKHCVFKFNSNGNPTGKFGQLGEGPGDLYVPGNLSILDGKFLIVGEYASRRRISVFDLNGKYVKVLKTKGAVFKPIALRDGKIAYASSRKSRKHSKGDRIWPVFIKDIHTGTEKEIISFENEIRGLHLKTGAMIMFGNNAGEVILKKTKKGNLLVGISSTPVLKIYSPDGKLILIINLKISPIVVTDKYIRNFKQQAINGMKEDLPANEYLFYEKLLKNASFKQLFAEYLPYYKRIMVDADGNLLVFRWLDCIDKGIETVQIYNADGKFISETHFSGNIFDYQKNNVDRNLVFSGKGIIGVFRQPDDDGETYRLMKVNYKY